MSLVHAKCHFRCQSDDALNSNVDEKQSGHFVLFLSVRSFGMGRHKIFLTLFKISFLSKLKFLTCITTEMSTETSRTSHFLVFILGCFQQNYMISTTSIDKYVHPHVHSSINKPATATNIVRLITTNMLM